MRTTATHVISPLFVSPLLAARQSTDNAMKLCDCDVSETVPFLIPFRTTKPAATRYWRSVTMANACVYTYIGFRRFMFVRPDPYHAWTRRVTGYGLKRTRLTSRDGRRRVARIRRRRRAPVEPRACLTAVSSCARRPRRPINSKPVYTSNVKRKRYARAGHRVSPPRVRSGITVTPCPAAPAGPFR